MLTTTKDTFRFAYGVGEAIEGDLIALESSIGLDECEPEEGIRKFKRNGEKYYTIVSEYADQQRLSAGHIGCLTIRHEGLEAPIVDGVEVVVTSTAIKLAPDEDDMGFSEFEYDGSPKLIQKFTATL